MSSPRGTSPSAPAPFHTFTGQPTGVPQKKQGWSQATNRRLITLWDQHGRQWWAAVEIRSGMPTGMIEPKDFRAPWLPDQQYLVVNSEDASELYIDYRRMAADRKASEDEYHRAALQLAGDKKWPMPKRGDYPSEILEALGRPPKSVRLVVATWQGNPWMLGESDVADPRLAVMVEREAPPQQLRAEDWDAEDFGPDSYAALAKELGEEAEPVARAAWSANDEAKFGDRAEDKAFLEDEQSEDEQSESETTEAAAGAENDESDDDGIMGALNVGDENDLDDEYDAEAVGGKTVNPKKAERVARQAPRRPGATAKKGRGGVRGAVDPKKRGRSLADGATPVIVG